MQIVSAQIPRTDNLIKNQRRDIITIPQMPIYNALSKEKYLFGLDNGK